MHIMLCIDVFYQPYILYHKFITYSTHWHEQYTTQHKTNLPLLLLTPAAWVSLHIDWPSPHCHAPYSYCTESADPPSPVSVVSSPSPGGWWLLSGHLQVDFSPIKWTHIHFEMSVLRQMRWEYTTVHWLSTITLVASCSHSYWRGSHGVNTQSLNKQIFNLTSCTTCSGFISLPLW